MKPSYTTTDLRRYLRGAFRWDTPEGRHGEYIVRMFLKYVDIRTKKANK